MAVARKGSKGLLIEQKSFGKSTRPSKNKEKREREDHNMPLSRSYKETIKERVERDPAFRAALFDEAINAFLNGETTVGKALLRDLVHSTIGFEGLAEELDKSSKSLHRMLAPSGNPRMENLFQVIKALKESEGISSKVTSTYRNDKRHAPV
ncbi:MAG: transcriptional regulator [Chlorobiales bacterium]|nr:transcriptional regulator [Chlorobiales bacterium]